MVLHYLKKIYVVHKICCTLALVLLLLTYLSLPAAASNINLVEGEKSGDKGKKVILIDPGHGGIDGGGVSRKGTLEKNINLDISLKLRDELVAKGYKVLMIREDDRGLYTENGSIRKKKLEDLDNRCRVKEESDCDMFISIHLNMFPQSQYFGAQVWYSKNPESKRFAGILQRNLRADLIEGNERVEKPALDHYRVLRCNDTGASVIVECGFLSNTNEEELLKTVEYQSKISKCITKSVEEYYKLVKLLEENKQ